MKNLKTVSSYRLEVLLKDLIREGKFNEAKHALDIYSLLDIEEVSFYLGGCISEGVNLYDRAKDFAKKYNLAFSEKAFEDGVLYKIKLF